MLVSSKICYTTPPSHAAFIPILTSDITHSSVSKSLASPTFLALASSAISPSTASHPEAPSYPAFDRRAAIPACLKSTELSCLNLAANCIDSVNADNRFSLWGIRSCAVAATCYGVGDLIASARCQTGFTDIANNNQNSLDYNTIYSGLVGSCSSAPGGCPVTQQDYLDWYYGTLTQINTANWPTSNAIVVAYFAALTSWTATGSTVPYTNLNDFYHYSTYPPAAPTTTSTTLSAYTPVPWNPNSVPPPGAVSQTFVKSSTTVVIPVPTITVTVTVVDVTITLVPGGTPVGGVVPTDVTQPGAVSPTFNPNPIVPLTSSSVTFVAGTWTSVVAAPTSTNAPVAVHGPPDDGNGDDNSWLLVLGLLGYSIVGTLPSSVSVIGAAIPVPEPPSDWPDSGGWTPPPPIPGSGGDDPDDPDDPNEPATCTFRALPPYTLPYDGESGMDDDDDGSFVRRMIDYENRRRSSNSTHRLYKRAVRRIVLGSCNSDYSRNGVSLGSANWYTINPPNVNPPITSASTSLYVTPNSRHVSNDGKVAEHLFEFRYIRDFFTEQFTAADCPWLEANAWNNRLPNGQIVADAIISAIDQAANLVWVALELNRAKSYVANNDRPSANSPPLNDIINGLSSLDPNSPSVSNALQVETLIRAFGALGQYYHDNADQFQATGQRVMNILAQITPSSPVFPPLDTRFYNFLRTTFSTYPNAISSRGTNMLNKYNGRLNILLAQAQAAQPPPSVPPTVPQCFAVYHDATITNRVASAGNQLNWQNLIPPPNPHPGCNTAGTTGALILYYDAQNGNPVYFGGNSNFRITALGGPQYGLTDLSNGYVFLDVNLGDTYGAVCNDIRIHPLGPAGTRGLPTTKFNLDCLGGSGRTLSDLQYVSPNGASQECYFNNYNDGTGKFDIVCSASRGAVDACLAHARQVLGTPNAQTSVPYMRFQAF